MAAPMSGGGQGAAARGPLPRRISLPHSASAWLLLAIALAIGFGALSYLVLGAVWSGGPEACRIAQGACWPFVAERWSSMLFGFLPERQRWLVAVMGGLLAAALLAGHRLGGPSRARLTTYALALCLAIGLVAHLSGWAVLRGSEIGGLLLTVTVSGFAILTGLPLGLALALMRCSKLPLVRAIATIWIEIWRGVPTVVVLFFAIAVFPLLVPKEVDISKLLRALVAFTLLTSALFAEAFRGGVQAVGEGQREAAWSLGLGTAATLRLVILPQALAVALPNLVNVCVALIKETTLVYLIGLYDFFGVIQVAVIEPRWAGGSALGTGYAMAAGGFLVVCAGLSHVARRLELRLKRGAAR